MDVCRIGRDDKTCAKCFSGNLSDIYQRNRIYLRTSRGRRQRSGTWIKNRSRIGPKAYLGPGGAFAGGTLARDIAFLTQLGQQNDLPIYLVPAVRASNDAHKNWPRRRLTQLLGTLNGKTIVVWG